MNFVVAVLLGLIGFFGLIIGLHLRYRGRCHVEQERPTIHGFKTWLGRGLRFALIIFFVAEMSCVIFLAESARRQNYQQNKKLEELKNQAIRHQKRTESLANLAAVNTTMLDGLNVNLHKVIPKSMNSDSVSFVGKYLDHFVSYQEKNVTLTTKNATEVFEVEIGPFDHFLKKLKVEIKSLHLLLTSHSDDGLNDPQVREARKMQATIEFLVHSFESQVRIQLSITKRKSNP